MIFVTVGTHEQQFNRLIEAVDMLVEQGIINEEVIMQTGFSTYEPKHCIWKKLISYKEMIKNVENARIVITHGGPASFIMPLQMGKVPVVVPRQKQYDEHVNDHQLEFAKAVEERQGNILVVDNISGLKECVLKYDQLIKDRNIENKSNNKTFNEMLIKEICSLFNND